jgi:hypothetical protein
VHIPEYLAQNTMEFCFVRLLSINNVTIAENPEIILRVFDESPDGVFHSLWNPTIAKNLKLLKKVDPFNTIRSLINLLLD